MNMDDICLFYELTTNEWFTMNRDYFVRFRKFDQRFSNRCEGIARNNCQRYYMNLYSVFVPDVLCYVPSLTLVQRISS